MALITDASITWSAPIVLTADEVWQAREGGAFVTTTGSPATEDGVLLRKGTAIHFSAGLSVRYRSVSPKPVLIAREAV